MGGEPRQASRGSIPREAREGLMRAWIALLQQRHPGVVWVPVESADITVEAHCGREELKSPGGADDAR